jgi:pimeloyl-ACP methyl ester carboxylesterase
MALHHVVCIHGIGQHSNQWTDDPDDGGISFDGLLQKLWNDYGLTANKGPFKDNVKIHPIHYSDEIDSIFKRWQDYANDLKSSLSFSEALLKEAAWFTDAIDQAGQGMDKQEFAYSHLMDLILFAGSATLQDRLVSYVASQVMEIIANRGDLEHVSVVGHSMGSAMAHKVIQYLYHTAVQTPQGEVKLEGDFKFKNVTMVANTSYALSRNRAMHYSASSKVRPSLKADEGCCTSWINVNHMLDPVGQFMAFDSRKNPLWLDPEIAARCLAVDIVPTRLSSKQVHAINHYFRDPVVHLPFFEMALGINVPSAMRKKAHADFERSTPEGALKTVRDQLSGLSIHDTDSFRRFYEALLYAKNQLKVLP